MSAIANNHAEELVVHVAGPRPTPDQFLRELSDVAVAVPLSPPRRW